MRALSFEATLKLAELGIKPYRPPEIVALKEAINVSQNR